MSRRWPFRRAVAIVTVAFVAPGVAQAKPTNGKIVLGQSIGDVSVGMTRAQVEGLLGHGLLLGSKGVRFELWSNWRLTFFFKGSSASATTFGGETNNPGYLTPQKIGVGAPTKQVESAYPSLHCMPSDNPTQDHPWKSCTRYGPQGHVTVFYFDAGNDPSTLGDVTRIAVGTPLIASTP